MGPGERLSHAGLTVAGAIGLVLLGQDWLRQTWTGDSVWLTAVASLLLLTHVLFWSAQWLSLPQMRRPTSVPTHSRFRIAAVTTFVKSHEPMSMLEGTLRAMLDMRMAHDTWLLDESDDMEVRELCVALGVRHFSRAGLHRYQQGDGLFRAATKHGNYNAWLDSIGYEAYDVLVMFDVDHVPMPQYLERTVGFLEVGDVGFVQPPQVYYNQQASFVARGSAEESYYYYSSGLMASYGVGHAIVIGSHGVHRLSALRAVGGFPAHDAEDLYLTMLYPAAGWRGIFVPEVLALGTTPVDWQSYLQQQRRWTRSLLDLKLRYFPKSMNELSFAERSMNFAHGLFFVRPLLIPAAYATLAWLLVFNVTPPFLRPRAVIAMAGMLALLGTLNLFRQRFFLDKARERGVHWRSTVLQFAKWPVMLQAAVQAIRGRQFSYAITKKGTTADTAYANIPANVVVAVGITLAWIAGTLRNHRLDTPLQLAAIAALLVSVTLASISGSATATIRLDEMYRARRKEIDVEAGRAGASG